MGNNIFEDTANQIKGNKIVILFFIMSAAMLFIGCVHFIEDTLSSLYGIQELERAFGVTPATYDITYWTMALSAQVAQVVFLFMFMKNTKKYKWALWVALAALALDFLADVWYRSNELMFTDIGIFLTASALTLVYFTLGSEIFLSVGLGLTLELFGPAVRQLIEFINYTWMEMGGKGGGGGYRPRPQSKSPPKQTAGTVVLPPDL